MFILESQWGNDGYAFWYKLMEQLCESQGHYYDYSTAESKVYLSAYCKVPEQRIEEIIRTLCTLGEIDQELWDKGRIIWCQQFVDSLEPLYKKRKSAVPEKPVIDVAQLEPAETTAEPEPEAKPKKRKQKSIPKVQYAEFVTMREQEYEKLVEEFGEQRTRRMIEILDNYKGSNGKKYDSDYRAILSWVVKRLEDEESRNGGMNNGYGTNGQFGGGFTPSGGFRNS